MSVLHNHLALTYLKLGNTKQASEFAGMAAAEAETLSDPRSRAWVAETQAAIALARGEFDEAIGLADRALGLESAGASPQTVMSALLRAAKAHRQPDASRMRVYTTNGQLRLRRPMAGPFRDAKCSLPSPTSSRTAATRKRHYHVSRSSRMSIDERRLL